MNILHNWKIVHRTNSAGADALCVGGRVFGNPRFTTGEPITTSSISWYRLEAGSTVIMTRNGSEYMLGKPHASEPFANRRLIRYLEQRGRLAEPHDSDAQTQSLPRFDPYADKSRAADSSEAALDDLSLVAAL